MPVKKEVCRHFLRGSCQFGQRCRYLHVNPQQQRPNNVFGAGAQSASFQPQKSNPYGFGVQNNSQQKPINKPFENTWTRFSPASTGNAPSSRQSENQAQANHKCTDPESCRRIIVEDFEHERPLWKLTCYGHWKNAPCDIVGDISYEELRTAAYDDAKRGLIFQSIVDRERNLLSAKLQEFQNLCKPNGALPNLTPPANQNSFPGTGPNAFAQTPQNNAPTVSSFSQLGASQNVGFGPRPPAPSNNVFVQTNPFGVPSQNSSVFVTKGLSSERQGKILKVLFVMLFLYSSSHIPGSSGDQFPALFVASPFTSPPTIFGNNTFVRAESNPVTPSAVSAQIPRVDTPGLLKGLNSNSNANGEVKQAYTQSAELSGVDVSVWLRTKWSPGEIPEEAPPDAVCS